jgi:hypothetical protein
MAMAALLSSLLLSCAAAPSHTGPGAKVPEGQLEGRSVTAKIDLPVHQGMLVYGNGEIDFATYRVKLESLGASIRRYERARITKVTKKGNQLQIRLNYGGRTVGLSGRNALRWVRPEQMNSLGTMILVDYGHPPTADDMRPERVAHSLRDVLEVEGVGAPADAAPPPGTASPAVPPAVKLLSVEPRPSRVVRGKELNLTVHFMVEGASTGQPLGLTISRQLYRGEKPLFSAPRVQQGHWSAGVHSAHFAFTVPPAAGEGMYRFKASVSHDGKEESGEALFEVLTGGD